MKFTLFIIAACVVVYATADDWVCEPNVRYIENECNGCFCTGNGLLGCTEKACLEPKYSKLFNCDVGTSFDQGCNKCWCIKDYGTVCTDKKC